jgi:hypothetical protein
MKLLADGAKTSAILDAVNKLKNGEFKATAIKVELEAQMNRGGDNNCGYCDEGYHECEYCSNGSRYCNDCDESGVQDDDEGNEIACETCEGEGRYGCDECDGEGNVTCGECDGDWESEGGFGDTITCHDFILEKLVPMGLAEEIPSGEDYKYGRKYRPISPLVFSKFYNDGSVDSEHTFTLLLDKAENIFLLPKILEVFTQLHEQINGDTNMQVDGAGMHIALLNEANGYYDPHTTRNTQQTHFRNYSRSMQMLLPALYFLGSSNEVSRGLRFREPRVAEYGYNGSKYHAINYGFGALEFRLFETCYDSPETILDFVCVIANSMKYWRMKYIPFRMKGIDKVYFGNDKDRTLKRFYMQREQIDVLNGGLRILKPSYYTIKDVKKQRNFHVTKATIDSSIKQQRKEVELEYREYEQRFAWRLEIKRHHYMAELMDSRLRDNIKSNKSPLDLEVEFKKEADTYVKRESGYKKNVAQYITDRLNEIEHSDRGRFCLESA